MWTFDFYLCWTKLPCKTVYTSALCWIEHPCSIRAWIPLSFFSSLFLSLSLRLTLWSSEARWAHFLTWACKTLARGCPAPMWSSASPVSRALLVFCVNQGISASLSLSLLLSYHQLQTTRFQSIQDQIRSDQSLSCVQSINGPQQVAPRTGTW